MLQFMCAFYTSNPFKPTLFLLPGGGGGSGGTRGEMSLAEVQCHLDREGASDLVIDLIMNATSDRIFQESILLAIALLEGGNPVIQVIILLGHFKCLCFTNQIVFDQFM